MIITKENILRGLKYYNISNNHYKEKCLECLEYIFLSNSLREKTNELIDILTDNTKMNDLWGKEKIEIFGEEYHPFITSVIVLCGYNIHKENMTKMGFTSAEKEIYKNRVKETLLNDLDIRGLSSIRVSQMIWAYYFITTRLIEVGRLQYENCKTYIKIHIPAGEKLEHEKVVKSIMQSEKEIRKYFGLNNPDYLLNSWIISKGINEIIPKNSNIYRLYEMFDVKDSKEDATDSILNFVFGITEKVSDYSKLTEKTSLQKLLKQQLMNGIQFKVGIGKLKK